MIEKNLIKKFVIGTKEYFISKTEVRCVDAKKGSLGTIKLNELDPNHQFMKYIPIKPLLFLLFYAGGLCIGLILNFTKHIQLNPTNLSINLVFIFFLIYFFRKRYVHSWSFYYLASPVTAALHIPHSRKHKETIQQFVVALSDAIKHADMSAQDIVHLLAENGLLTQNEHNKLAAKAATYNKPSMTDSNIINIRNNVQ